MENSNIKTESWLSGRLLAIAFILIAGASLTIFSPWGKQRVEPAALNYALRIGWSLLLAILACVVKRNTRLERYAPLMNGLVILSVTVSLDWVMGTFLMDSLHITDSSPAGWAGLKVNEAFIVLCVIILLTRVSGEKPGAIYIQKGKLKQGLLIGGIAFLLAAVASVPIAQLFFKAENLSLARILPWAPWIVLIVLANGALEEVMFRGLFLRKLEPFFGKFFANCLIALVFTILHRGSYYTSEDMLFLVVLTPLALIWGYLMQKTEGVWASLLFHAGMDIPIFLGIFSVSF